MGLFQQQHLTLRLCLCFLTLDGTAAAEGTPVQGGSQSTASAQILLRTHTAATRCEAARSWQCETGRPPNCGLTPVSA
jgi:hypothetical protein